ncbi:TrbI/VirB10 family protein [Sulfuricystis multivorans]|uniref:TrbI/VirB10 family protein n=1 Tax=Sulfuricystis multivorans TaxID=2211108 RepID=UPI000F82EB03|nr:TrbI/VirB10 family protein [Sulfuricystis multivorans]
MAGIKAKGKAISQVRRKQIIILVSLLVVVVLIAFGAAMLGEKKKAPPPRAQETTRKAFGAQGEQINQADIWRTQEGARISQLQQQLSDIQAKLAAKEKADADAKIRDQEAAAKREEEEKKKREREEAERRASKAPPATGLPMQTGPLGQPGPPDFNGGAPKAEIVKGIMRVDMGNSQSKGLPAPTGKNNITHDANDENNGAVAKATSDQNAETYIPAGTFMRGVLLAGLDAPTGGQAQQNPHPVVIEVLDMASLPNKFKADYKNCRFTANGAGDLSSERALIRLDRLSCISEDGGALDVSVKGYVADSTGKAGIRGRLVSKQGQVLANALLAGVASGIGTAFSQGAMTTSVSPLGATQTVKDGQQLQAGIGQGVGNALQQLSRYYIQLADKMFPVIEVDAGQPVDIVITKGISVARK